MHHEESMPNGTEHSPQEVWEELESLKKVVTHIAEAVGYPLEAPGNQEINDEPSLIKNGDDAETVSPFKGIDEGDIEDELTNEDVLADTEEFDEVESVEDQFAEEDLRDDFELSDSLAFARFDNESPAMVNPPEPIADIESDNEDAESKEGQESSFDHEFFLTVKPEDDTPSTVHLVDEGKVYDTSSEEETSVTEPEREDAQHISVYSLDEETPSSEETPEKTDPQDDDVVENEEFVSNEETEFDSSLPVEEVTEELEESPVVEVDEKVSVSETVEEVEETQPETPSYTETSANPTPVVTSVDEESPKEISSLRGEVIQVDTSTAVFSLASKEPKVINTTATKDTHQTRHLPPLRRPGSVLPTRPGQQTTPRREPPKLQLPKASTNKHSGLRIFGRAGITGARASQPRNSQREFA